MNKAYLSQIATRLFDTPLAIHPAKLDVIFAVLAERLNLDLDALGPLQNQKSLFGQVPENKKEMSVIKYSGQARNGAGNQGQVRLAVIPVFGSLVHRAGGLDAMSGLRSYVDIRNDFNRAYNDSAIDAVIFEHATNGGEVHGCFDLVDEIYEARQEDKKKIYAIVNEYSYSAGYALASACHEIYLTRTSGIGSIGVICRHLDQSEKNKKEGLNFTTLYEGDHKNDFSPDAPLKDGALEWLKQSLKESYGLFVETVARNRNMKSQAVRDTQAGIFEGKAAVEAGLADAVLSFDQAVLRIAANIKPTGGRLMSNQKPNSALQHQLEALFKGSSDQENQEALAALGYAPSAGMVTEEQKASFGMAQFEAGKKEGAAEGNKAAREEIQEIAALCSLAKEPARAFEFISQGTSLAEVRKTLTESQAKGNEQQIIKSTVGATTHGAVSPLVANAQARQDKLAAR